MRAPLVLLVANLGLIAGPHGGGSERLEVPELRLDSPAIARRVIDLDAWASGPRVATAVPDRMPIAVPDDAFADAQPWPRGMVIAPPETGDRIAVVLLPAAPAAVTMGVALPASGVSGVSGVSGPIASGLSGAAGIRP